MSVRGGRSKFNRGTSKLTTGVAGAVEQTFEEAIESVEAVEVVSTPVILEAEVVEDTSEAIEVEEVLE